MPVARHNDDDDIYQKTMSIFIDVATAGINSILFYRIKRDILQTLALSVLLYGCTTWTLKNP